MKKQSLILGLFTSALLLLGFLLVTILLCFSPPIFDLVYQTMDYRERNEEIANIIVNKLWDSSDFRDIPRIGAIMFQKEIIHYEDIRIIIRRMIFGLSGITIIMIGLRNSINWIKTLAGSLVIFILIGGTLGIWALINWKHMFDTLHWWLFQNDSWKLPNRSVTLVLFPYPVWQKLGAVVLIMVLAKISLSLLLTWATARLIKKKEKQPKLTNSPS